MHYVDYSTCVHHIFTYRSHERVDETSTDASADLSDRQDKPSGYALLVRHMGQGQVSLCHADGQWTISLVRGKRETMVQVETRDETDWGRWSVGRLLLQQQWFHLFIVVIDLVLGLWRQLNVVSSVYLLCDRSDLLGYRHLWREKKRASEKGGKKQALKKGINEELGICESTAAWRQD